MRMLLSEPGLMICRAMEAHNEAVTFCPWCRQLLVPVRDEDGLVVNLMQPVAWDDGQWNENHLLVVQGEPRVDHRGYPLGWLYGERHRCRSSVVKGVAT